MKKRLMPLQPMLEEASKSELSTFFSEPLTYMNTSGNSLVLSASRMPPKPYMLGSLIPNQAFISLVIAPPRPSWGR